MSTENRTNRPVLPNVEAMLKGASIVQDFAMRIHASAHTSVENVDHCLDRISAMETYLKEFSAGQSQLIEVRAETDQRNLKELVQSHHTQLREMKGILLSSRKAFVSEESDYEEPQVLKLIPQEQI
jgi:hypothetical protein